MCLHKSIDMLYILSYITLYFITHNFCKKVYFFGIDILCVSFFPYLSRNDAIILSSHSNKRAVYINENDTMCKKLSTSVRFFSTYLYMILFRQPPRCLISLLLPLYIQKLCKKEVITYWLWKIMYITFNSNILDI